MPRTWQNYECIITTHNTENNLGNSTYRIRANGMTRHAPINAQRAPGQVQAGNPSICYVDPASAIWAAIENDTDDSMVTVSSVSGDDIYLKSKSLGVQQGNMRYLIGAASRVPQIGLHTLDFINNDGALSHIHIGHAVLTLIPGPPP